jgi:chaperonin cofactor prefoldin
MENDRVFELIYKNEECADKILANKQELLSWDKKRQGNREALRELRKSEDKKAWITVGSMLIEMDRLKAIDVLSKGILEYFLLIALNKISPSPLRAS